MEPSSPGADADAKAQTDEERVRIHHPPTTYRFEIHHCALVSFLGRLLQRKRTF